MNLGLVQVSGHCGHVLTRGTKNADFQLAHIEIREIFLWIWMQ